MSYPRTYRFRHYDVRLTFNRPDEVATSYGTRALGCEYQEREVSGHTEWELVSTEASELDTLKAENEKLKEQLAKIHKLADAGLYDDEPAMPRPPLTTTTLVNNLAAACKARGLKLKHVKEASKYQGAFKEGSGPGLVTHIQRLVEKAEQAPSMEASADAFRIGVENTVEDLTGNRRDSFENCTDLVRRTIEKLNAEKSQAIEDQQSLRESVKRLNAAVEGYEKKQKIDELYRIECHAKVSAAIGDDADHMPLAYRIGLLVERYKILRDSKEFPRSTLAEIASMIRMSSGLEFPASSSTQHMVGVLCASHKSLMNAEKKNAKPGTLEDHQRRLDEVEGRVRELERAAKPGELGR